MIAGVTYVAIEEEPEEEAEGELAELLDEDAEPKLLKRVSKRKRKKSKNTYSSIYLRKKSLGKFPDFLFSTS